MKLAVVGSRDFDNYKLLVKTLKKYEISVIVSGGAKGADSLAEKYADKKDIKKKIFRANWDKYGKAAGYIRNKEIVDYCEGLVAFWDGESKGTKHSIDLATKQNKLLEVVKFERT